MLAARPCAAAAATAGTAGGAGALLLGRVSDAQPVGPVRWRLGIFTATAALFLLACTAGHPCPYFMSSADPPHPVHLAEASGFCRLDGASRASVESAGVLCYLDHLRCTDSPGADELLEQTTLNGVTAGSRVQARRAVVIRLHQWCLEPGCPVSNMAELPSCAHRSGRGSACGAPIPVSAPLDDLAAARGRDARARHVRLALQGSMHRAEPRQQASAFSWCVDTERRELHSVELAKERVQRRSPAVQPCPAGAGGCNLGCKAASGAQCTIGVQCGRVTVRTI